MAIMPVQIMSSPTLAWLTGADRDSALRRMEVVAKLLDSAFVLPGTISASASTPSSGLMPNKSNGQLRGRKPADPPQLMVVTA